MKRALASIVAAFLIVYFILAPSVSKHHSKLYLGLPFDA